MHMLPFLSCMFFAALLASVQYTLTAAYTAATGLVILMILPVMSPQSLARFNVSTRSATAGYCQRLTCPKEEQRGFLEHLISRAELGAPGYEAMLTMTPCDWWPLLANRTLWLVGDSLSQEFMKAFQCFMYEFWDLDMVDLKHRVVEADFVRDKVRLGWCAHLLEGARICHHRVNDAPEYTAVLPYFYQGLTGKRNDIVMMNTGIWSNDVDTYTSRLSTFAQYYQQHKQELPFFVWRDSSAQFFHTPTGDFDRSEHAVCQPIGYPSGGVTLDSSNKLVIDLETSPQLQVVHEGGWRNQISRPVMHALGIPVIETWNKSIPIWQYHKNAHDDPNHHDCTHWCHPSAYLRWLYDSLVTLQKLQPAIAEHVRQMPSQEQLDELDLKAGAEHIVVDPF